MHQTDSAFHKIKVILYGTVFHLAEVGVPTDVNVVMVSDINDRSDVPEFRGAATVYF